MKIISTPEVKEILLKYKNEESRIDEKLKFGSNKQYIKERNNVEEDNIPSREEVKRRNSQLLKELETVKANLRSKAIYSPTEIHWKHISDNYKADPALPVKTWRCYLPVYV
ncbi:unnamed protein product [Acanthoscelides obtectus]|uniref:Uncharacterized protein n=1 Tax=Acanthoscelides obtectus TaxID=200917 RepID=A0A9P0KE21_ACAOB|nr:unnamed protein product [Acanthoscelides obtectus]CAK1672668.1 hypothetical protein AOBTE_LOCUS29032 [Acanthoscelides obtectus]